MSRERVGMTRVDEIVARICRLNVPDLSQQDLGLVVSRGSRNESDLVPRER